MEAGKREPKSLQKSIIAEKKNLINAVLEIGCGHN